MALKIGMTPDQFWNDDPELMGAYLEAYQQKFIEKYEYDNAYAHLQGQYFMLAIAQCLQFTKTPKKIYPKKPFDLGLKKKQNKMSNKDYEEIRKIQVQNMVKRFNQNKK